MEVSEKIVNCIQPLTIFAKQFILDVSQGYMSMSLIRLNKMLVRCYLLHKKLGLQFLRISSDFKFSFIFTLPCGKTLLITNSIHVFLISN